MTIILESLAEDRWVAPRAALVEIPSALDGRVVAAASSHGLDFAAIARHARQVGGPSLRRLTFHERADLLKRLATYLNERKEALYELAFETGATRRDSALDIDGGIGTLFSYASRGRKELPAERFIIDGVTEGLSKRGSFVGTHVLTSLNGVAVHVNAYNFPCWGLLEKLAPSVLAGAPVIAKPATPTAYVAHALAKMIADSNVLPPGSFQFVGGGLGDLLDHLAGQDVLSFTGSIETSERLRNHPAVSRYAVRFIAERDSLNAAVLGPDVVAGAAEFDLFVNEVAQEMTVKAGQKCTAIRRVLAPRSQADSVCAALEARLSKVVVGDPRREDVAMGPLVGLSQRETVREKINEICAEAEVVFGDPTRCEPVGGDAARGAFLSPVLLRCNDPVRSARPHTTEAFGPVSTVMPYEDLNQAIDLARRGEGSLVASVFTYDPAVATELTFGIAAYHGRLVHVDRDCASESTGHGPVLPGLVHGGPGRAGGGEELGGLRALAHYMQRTAIQASPARLAALTKA